ncbi:unnamed protein product [Lepeophtheirus salmonis]|uniref:(salmon louse) hypothetical protein n=1 Tax=Lepeophtheirus salmonis TaxID=72036 RepID=A0A7R8CK78_LEPSM|nr:unnamed protein product [Lepeophtheirus salmonis]CAF2845969.1 unnamed protein product [Lepeophtheirus salmonis]
MISNVRIGLPPKTQEFAKLTFKNQCFCRSLQKDVNFRRNSGSNIKYTKVTVHICEDARPRYTHARHVPVVLCDVVNDKIKDMVCRGTFEKVHTSEWATPIVTIL